MNPQTTEEKIADTHKYIDYGSKVKFVRDGETRHIGVVVGLTTTFAKIFKYRNRKEDYTGDVNPESAEWYPIECKGGGVFLV